MSRTIVFYLVVLILATVAINSGEVNGETRSGAQTEVAIEEFWGKFRDAVVKGNKTAVAGLSRFPISMPYGIPSVRTRAQLFKRYRDVFNHDGNSAAECFTTAKPVVDAARPREFTVGCKNIAGDEVIIYTFLRTPAGWRFAHLDNINE